MCHTPSLYARSRLAVEERARRDAAARAAAGHAAAAHDAARASPARQQRAQQLVDLETTTRVAPVVRTGGVATRRASNRHLLERCGVDMGHRKVTFVSIRHARNLVVSHGIPQPPPPPRRARVDAPSRARRTP